MSHPVNTQWIETAMENLEDALQIGEWGLASDIMAYTRDNGFEDAWKEMFDMFNHYKFADR